MCNINYATPYLGKKIQEVTFLRHHCPILGFQILKVLYCRRQTSKTL